MTTERQLLPGLPVSALQLVCPVIAAAILVYREEGRAGVVALLTRAADFKRIRPALWYVPILFLMPAMTIAALGAAGTRRPVAGDIQA